MRQPNTNTNSNTNTNTETVEPTTTEAVEPTTTEAVEPTTTEAVEPTTTGPGPVPECPDADDPAVILFGVLDAAAEATDTATGTVPLAHVAAIVDALKPVRGNAKAMAIANWSMSAFTRFDPSQCGAVLNVVAKPPTIGKAVVAVPDYVKLAHALDVLESARVILCELADPEDRKRAIGMIEADDYVSPDWVAERAKSTANAAGKGPRGTGSKVDLADAIAQALEANDGQPMTVADVKSWAAAELGASKGGAIDNRHAELASATGTDADGRATAKLYAAGIRATVIGGEPTFILAD